MKDKESTTIEIDSKTGIRYCKLCELVYQPLVQPGGRFPKNYKKCPECRNK
jgi:hypothetical protein